MYSTKGDVNSDGWRQESDKGLYPSDRDMLATRRKVKNCILTPLSKSQSSRRNIRGSTPHLINPFNAIHGKNASAKIREVQTSIIQYIE